jgi:hypothetical protein
VADIMAGVLVAMLSLIQEGIQESLTTDTGSHSVLLQWMGIPSTYRQMSGVNLLCGIQ